MTTRTHWARHAFSVTLVLFGLLVFTMTGCSSEDSGAGDDAPTFNGVDPTLSCAGDTVGWNFATGGSSLDTAQGSALSGIQITEASYGVSCNASFTGNATRPATAVCNGQYHCEFQPYPTLLNKYDPAPGCNKTFTVKWKCGADSDEFTRTYPGESAYTNIAIDCGPKLVLQDVSYGGNCGTSSAEESAPCSMRATTIGTARTRSTGARTTRLDARNRSSRRGCAPTMGPARSARSSSPPRRRARRRSSRATAPFTSRFRARTTVTTAH